VTLRYPSRCFLNYTVYLGQRALSRLLPVGGSVGPCPGKGRVVRVLFRHGPCLLFPACPAFPVCSLNSCVQSVMSCVRFPKSILFVSNHPLLLEVSSPFQLSSKFPHALSSPVQLCDCEQLAGNRWRHRFSFSFAVCEVRRLFLLCVVPSNKPPATSCLRPSAPQS
jgi:hypothetical protein